MPQTNCSSLVKLTFPGRDAIMSVQSNRPVLFARQIMYIKAVINIKITNPGISTFSVIPSKNQDVSLFMLYPKYILYRIYWELG